jgi:hypothetical protein
VSAEEAEKERAKEAAEEAAEAAAEADMAERRRRLREGSERGKALAAEAAAKREQNANAERAQAAEEAKRRAAAPSGQAAAAAAAAAAPPAKTKYVIVGNQAQGGPPLYFLVAEGRFTDDSTVPSKYTLSTASKVWAKNPANGKHEYYIPSTNAWQPTVGARRVLTFRRKPKSRSKNGRRPTRKSPVRRNR